MDSRHFLKRCFNLIIGRFLCLTLVIGIFFTLGYIKFLLSLSRRFEKTILRDINNITQFTFLRIIRIFITLIKINGIAHRENPTFWIIRICCITSSLLHITSCESFNDIQRIKNALLSLRIDIHHYLCRKILAFKDVHTYHFVCAGMIRGIWPVINFIEMQIRYVNNISYDLVIFVIKDEECIFHNAFKLFSIAKRGILCIFSSAGTTYGRSRDINADVACHVSFGNLTRCTGGKFIS